MNSVKTLIGVLAACGVVLAATGASAQESAADSAAPETEQETPLQGHGLGIAVRTGSQYETDSGFHALNKGTAFPVGGAVELDYRLDYIGVDGLTAFASARWTGQSSTRFEGQADFQWNRGLYLLGAQWGPWEWGTFRPVLRAAGGYATQRLELNTAQPTMTDRTHDLAGMGSLGFEWLTPRDFIKGAPIRMGLIGQVGYLAQTKADFDDMTSQADDDDWERDSLALGTLPTSGVFWDVGFNFVYEW